MRRPRRLAACVTSKLPEHLLFSSLKPGQAPHPSIPPPRGLLPRPPRILRATTAAHSCRPTADVTFEHACQRLYNSVSAWSGRSRPVDRTTAFGRLPPYGCLSGCRLLEAVKKKFLILVRNPGRFRRKAWFRWLGEPRTMSPENPSAGAPDSAFGKDVGGFCFKSGFSRNPLILRAATYCLVRAYTGLLDV
jgi:hypothetical protein